MTGNVATRGPESESAAPAGPGGPGAGGPRPARAADGVGARAAQRRGRGARAQPPDGPGRPGEGPRWPRSTASPSELQAVETDRDDEAHRTLCRIAELVADGVPEAGWSADEEIDVDTLRATSEAARGLHGKAATLLERLDAEKRHGPAAVVDSVATTLRVVGVVADLEVFERARH